MPNPLINDFLNEEIIDCNAQLNDDVAGAAVSINRQGEIKHAALFVRFNHENKIFHYTGKDVLLDDADSVSHHYYKGFLFVLPELIPSFLAQCELIAQKAQPIYGYFYSGSLYDDEGTFIAPGKYPESMTCVGFCLNVLKHFLGEDNLLHYTDWNSDTVSEIYIQEFFEKVKKARPTLSLDDFKKNVRRILPIEYFTAACADAVNVRKQYIDSNKGIVKQTLIQKRA